MNQLIALSKYRDSKINCHFLSVIVVYLQKRLGKDYQSRKPQLCCNEGKCNGPLMAHCPHNLTSPCCECEKDGVSDVNLVTIRIVNVNTVLRVAAWSAPKKRMWMETTIVKFATRRLVIHARWQNAKVKITTAESV
jgi:hypothetical protein